MACVVRDEQPSTYITLPQLVLTWEQLLVSTYVSTVALLLYVVHGGYGGHIYILCVACYGAVYLAWADRYS